MRYVFPLALACLTLTGCSTATDIVAAPFHIAADVVRVVPVVGGAAAIPLDVVGDVID